MSNKDLVKDSPSYKIGYEQGRADEFNRIISWLKQRYTLCTNDGDYYSISEVEEQLQEQNKSGC